MAVAGHLNDAQIMQRIHSLIDEEHTLLERGEQGALDAAGRKRLRELQVELDQLWDLIRQRRAKRHAGFDPDAARLRSVRTVEGYRQ
ncbi:MAG TPA: DUF2630 family protein [Chloroflexota bacterium]|nr:DUF2630 family protein [Chloroflexota bacterium]